MHLFLSPHLDDAVLSCGGLIHQLTSAGDAVTILTVMAGDPPDPLPDSPLIRELHQRWEAGSSPVALRRQEDRDAARILGADVIHLDLPDCVYRTAGGRILYPYGDDDLFGEVDPEDPARDWLEQYQPPPAQRMYVPLAIGNHIDHQLVYDWGKQFANVWYYEEYPYAEHSRPQALNLQPQAVSLSEADFHARVEAVACHRSQISTFWRDLNDMETSMRRYVSQQGALVENYWR